MTADFIKKKYVHVFNAFDNDKSNFIERKDFENTANFTSESRGWAPGSDKDKENTATLLKIWDSLASHADKDNDGKVSVDEWVAMWDNYAKNPSSPLEWQSLYSKYIFDIEDVTGDGVIDIEEFSSVMETFGEDKTNVVKNFEKMAKGKSCITWPEFQELWKEYFTSDNPDAPGNLIFGEIPN